MISFITAAIAGLSLVGASPVIQERQQASITPTPAVPSAAASSAGSLSVLASSVVSSIASGAPGIPSVSGTGRDPVVISTSTAPSSALPSGIGSGRYPRYPCGAAYLLTYVATNVTLPVGTDKVLAGFGNWSTSAFFPNITNSSGASAVGARHTLNLQGVSIGELLVNRSTNATTGYRSYTWNSTNGPFSINGLKIEKYQTVLQWSDQGLDRGNRRSNTTVVNLFTNFCASSQAVGMQVVGALGNLELGNLQGAITGAARNTTKAA